MQTHWTRAPGQCAAAHTMLHKRGEVRRARARIAQPQLGMRREREVGKKESGADATQHAAAHT
eukprot:9524978-Alexandrium_andersonii.AAC.1